MSDFDDLEFLPDAKGKSANTVSGAMAIANFEAPATFTETCTKCNGSGQWRSYSGYTIRTCFACKGKGFKSFKTDPTARAASREYAATRKVATQTKNTEDFATNYPVEYEWLTSSAPTFAFAASLLDAVAKYGDLSEKQLAAVRSILAKRAAREEAKVAAKANATEVDVTKIQTAFDTARANHVPKPKLNLGNFTFSRAPDHGRNPGAIYVKEGETYLGKIVGGKLLPQLECTETRSSEIAAIAADPYAAALAYGERTRRCAICAHKLTNGVSVDIGIGPICRSNYGW